MASLGLALGAKQVNGSRRRETVKTLGATLLGGGGNRHQYSLKLMDFHRNLRGEGFTEAGSE